MKKKIDMVFVLLHYKNLKDTLDCINSIRLLKDSHYKIVVVDNGSNIKKDISILQGKADDLIIAEENLGFAKGNNLGVLKAKEYHPDFIAVINNDTVIEQKDFIYRVKQTYQNCPFDALGPKILTEGGESVNPFPAYQTLDEVEKAITKARKLIRIYHSPLWRTLLRFYSKTKQLLKPRKPLQNAATFLEDVSLHGCALIFSKKYYERYEDCFYAGTFLYHEEEFLTYRRKKDQLKFIYDPTILIFHKEGSSLNYNYDSNLYQKLIFREENIVQSLILLKKIMLEEKEI